MTSADPVAILLIFHFYFIVEEKKEIETAIS